MPPDPTPANPRGRDAAPINADSGWDLLMHTVSRTVPRYLFYTQRSVGKIRALRRR